MVTSFRYIRWIFTKTDNDWLAVIGNLQKAQRRWSRLARLMGRKFADAQMLGHFYFFIVQAILVFVTDTWLVTPTSVGYRGYSKSQGGATDCD